MKNKKYFVNRVFFKNKKYFVSALIQELKREAHSFDFSHAFSLLQAYSC